MEFVFFDFDDFGFEFIIFDLGVGDGEFMDDGGEGVEAMDIDFVLVTVVVE